MMSGGRRVAGVGEATARHVLWLIVDCDCIASSIGTSRRRSTRRSTECTITAGSRLNRWTSRAIRPRLDRLIAVISDDLLCFNRNIHSRQRRSDRVLTRLPSDVRRRIFPQRPGSGCRYDRQRQDDCGRRPKIFGSPAAAWDRSGPRDRRESQCDRVATSAVDRLSGDCVRGCVNHRSHKGAPVCDGIVRGTRPHSAPSELTYAMDGEVLTSTWHCWRFDLNRGEEVLQQRPARLKLFDVRIADGSVEVAV